ITLRNVIPEGAQFVKADPAPALVEGERNLVWTLPGLPPAGSHRITLVFRAGKPGPITSQAILTTRDGQQDTQTATTQVTLAQPDVKMPGPATAMVGAPVEYQIALRNTGTGTIPLVTLTDEFDAGLEHESRANPIKKTVGPLAAGESALVRLALTPR